MGRLDGKVAVITGAGSGIGAASARLFAAEGAQVLIADIDEASGHGVAKSIGDAATFLRTDVTSSTDMARTVEWAVSGHGRLDVYFNNAGIVPSDTTLVDLEEAILDRVMAVNIKGVWLGMKHALPVMVAAGKGSIINTASVSGLRGTANQFAYGATKGAVIQMTRNCAAECAAAGIRANAICPGSVLTPLSFSRRPNMNHDEVVAAFTQRQPLPRAGTADDIAAAAVWLASDESIFVTGQAIVVDGGMTSIRRV